MIRCIVFTLFASTVIGCAATIPVRVSVYQGGDDGLTNRLADRIREIVALPGTIRTRSAHQSELGIYIVGHVDWVKQGNDVKVIYEVRFVGSAKGDQTKASTRGSCLETNLDACAEQIVHATQAFAD